MSALNQSFSPQIQLLWNSAIVHTVWLVWRVRNNSIFGNERPNIHITLSQLWAILRRSDHVGLGTVRNSMLKYQILRNLHLILRLSRAPQILRVRWQLPRRVGIKINMDVSVTGSPGETGCSGVFRDWKGKVLHCFSFPFDNTYAFVAELKAGIFAIETASGRGWNCNWIESDSSYVVHILRSRSIQVPYSGLMVSLLKTLELDATCGITYI